jgi:hypothetical protein
LPIKQVILLGCLSVFRGKKLALYTLKTTPYVPLLCWMNTQHLASQQITPQLRALSTPHSRQLLVTAVLDFVAGTPLAPSEREQALLAQFVQGSLTIEQVLEYLEAD